MLRTRRRRSVAIASAIILSLMWPALPAGAVAVTNVTTAAPTHYTNSWGDVWATTWADDGDLYTASDDTTSFGGTCNSNFAISKLAGSNPASLTGSTVNCMTAYGSIAQEGLDGRTWKATGLISVDGILYAGITRQEWASINSSIIKSTDHGATWTRSASTNYSDPMWPGTDFPTPSFIQYGQDASGGVDGGDVYVYAISNQPGGWIDAESQILGRVLKDDIDNLDADDWQYYSGTDADGRLNSSWSSSASAATPINTQSGGVVTCPLDLSPCGRLSMGGAVYDQPLHMYVMPQFYYPNPTDSHKTIWQIYTAPAPWGPWTIAQTQDTSPHALYNPNIVSKFTSGDGRTLTVFTAGDYSEPVTEYHLQVMTIKLGSASTVIADSTTGTSINTIDYSGGTWTAESDASNVGAFNDNDHYTNTVGDYALARFTGTAATLYAVESNGTGGIGISICDANGSNCGAEAHVQTYSAARRGAQAVYSTGPLSWGSYALKIRADGVNNPEGHHYIAIDAVEVIGAVIDDGSTGTGLNQVDYSHGTWTGETDAGTVGAYSNNDHYSGNTGDYALVHFNGTSIAANVILDSGTGQAGFSICDANGSNCGSETRAMTYSVTRQGQQTVYTSGSLTRGTYTLKVRVTGVNNPGGWHYVGVDSFDVVS